MMKFLNLEGRIFFWVEIFGWIGFGFVGFVWKLLGLVWYILFGFGGVFFVLGLNGWDGFEMMCGGLLVCRRLCWLCW